MSIEEERLAASNDREENWLRWGPYLSERQWGTVREDYSEGGDATWSYFPHDHARSRAYRWGEDGLLGISDRQCRLCFSVGLWNGRDSIVKERLFGVTGPEGNHGEDVKECYYYLDSTPTHSYMKALYKYPQLKFPYRELVSVSQKRGFGEDEYELVDTGAFDESRYFDVQAEYAKAGPDDLLIKLTITNRGPQKAVMHALPQFYFRNTWTWECTDEGCTLRPSMRLENDVVRTNHETLGQVWLACDRTSSKSDSWPWLFTDNETNKDRHPGLPSESDFYKDALNDYVVLGDTNSVNPEQRGTKCSPYGLMMIEPGKSEVVRLRLTHIGEPVIADQAKSKTEAFRKLAFDDSFDEVFVESNSGSRCPSMTERISESSLTDDRTCDYATGLRRVAVDQAVLSLQREHLARWRSQWRWRLTSRVESRVATMPVATSVQSRCNFDARQMGIPLVRGMGLGVSHGPDGKFRRQFR